MQLIIGTGGLAKQALVDLKNKNRSTLDDLVFFDNTETAPESFYGHRVINSLEEINEPFSFAVCVGDPKWREFFFVELIKIEGTPMTVISENANVFEDIRNEILPGNLILSNVIIEPGAVIGAGCLINTSASIHHDAKIGYFCEIMPGAEILGGAEIGGSCRIGTRATILPNIKICNDVVVGAGAVVIEDINEPGTYVGVPARKVR
jgi:sugar O-acyltransferase (sialic acid O-acetyltransferase NeuD family)